MGKELETPKSGCTGPKMLIASHIEVKGTIVIIDDIVV
jgi:hypothetical protein